MKRDWKWEVTWSWKKGDPGDFLLAFKAAAALLLTPMAVLVFGLVSLAGNTVEFTENQ